MNRPTLTVETTVASDPNIFRDVSTIPGSVTWRVNGVKQTAPADLLAFLPALTFDDFAHLGTGQPTIASALHSPGLLEWEELRSADKREVVLRVDDPDLIWQWLQQHRWRWVVQQPLFHIEYRWGNHRFRYV